MRRHLVYRDDQHTRDYINARSVLSFIPGMPHQNPMAIVVEQLRHFANRNTPVIIEGPAGLGRYAVAEVLRDLDPSPDSDWITIPCAGADATRVDCFPEGRSLILREIAKAAPAFQLVLLGLMDRANVAAPRRVVCTTTCDLSRAASDGTFDSVLYQRLSLGARIIVPPLSSRTWDIPPLVVSAIREADPDRSVRAISYAALHLLINFDWAGQVEKLLRVVAEGVRRTQEIGANTLTLSTIANQFKRVTPPKQRPRDGEEIDDKALGYLRRLGSEEVAAFYRDQYGQSNYSESASDREFENGGWSSFDRDLWTGCYAVTRRSTAAWDLYLHMQTKHRTSGSEPSGTEPVEREQNVDGKPGDSEFDRSLIRIVWEEHERLSRLVKPIALDDSYGTGPQPSRRAVGNVTTIELGISPLFASPVWLTDPNWVLRDSWNVPLQWADTRIIFDLRRMERDLRGFVKVPASPDAGPVPEKTSYGAVQQKRASERVSIKENEFVFEGAAWRLSFAGKSVQTTDRVGLFYISILLKNPGQWIDAVKLRSLRRNSASVIAAHPVDDMGATKLFGSSRRPEPDLLLDEKAKREILMRKQKLDEDYKSAVNSDDLERAAKIDEERQRIDDTLMKATRLRGKPREFSSDDSRARDSVGHAIRYAINQIRALHPSLADHLTSSIDFGFQLRYSPEKPTFWIT